MKIIKRSGSEDIFDISKIEAAIRKANDSVIDYEKLGDDKIQAILSNVEKACENMKRSPMPSFSRMSAACCRETDGYSSCTSQAAARPMMFSQCVSGRRTPLPSVR